MLKSYCSLFLKLKQFILTLGQVVGITDDNILREIYEKHF